MADAEYEAAGATMLDDAAEVWARAELLLKVKEPIASEYGYFREDSCCSPTCTSRPTAR